jgi:hypothetical protein
MLKNINIKVFIISFAIGLFIVYIFSPPPEVIVKFPSPHNSGDILYREKDGSGCFKYVAENHECPLDKSVIRPQPLL